MVQLIFSVIALLGSGSLSAEAIYQWYDSDGRVHYSDQPHPNATKIITGSPQPDGQQLRRHQRTQDKIKQVVGAQQKARRDKQRIIQRERRQRSRAAARQARRCQAARQRVEEEQLRWQQQRRKGYQSKDRSRHREKQQILAYRMQQACDK